MRMKTVFQKLYDRIRSSGFLKSVLTLSSGVVVGQAINFIGMPFIGRIYTPAAMGDYALITSSAGVISAVACLGMMTVFMLPERDEEARGLSRLVVYATLLLTTVAGGGLWLLRDSYRIFHTTDTPYSTALLVLWLYIVINTINNICYAYVNRRKLYRVMFWNPVIGAGVNIGLSILFGLLGGGFVGYTMGSILSYCANIVHLILHANPCEKVTNPDYRCLPLLKSYKRFPLFQMPANLISSLSTQVQISMMETLFSSTTLGMYSMALKILSLPSALLATPVNRVYFQEASQRYNRGEDIGEFTFKILKTNIKIAIIPIAILTLFGEEIFSLFLGRQWRDAGTFAAVLGVYQLLLFCSSCTAGGFVILKQNRWNLALSLLSLAMNSLVFLVTRIFFQGQLGSCMILLTLSGSLYTLFVNGLFLHMAKMKISRYFRFVVLYIIFPMAVCLLLRYFVMGKGLL